MISSPWFPAQSDVNLFTSFSFSSVLTLFVIVLIISDLVVGLLVSISCFILLLLSSLNLVLDGGGVSIQAESGLVSPKLPIDAIFFSNIPCPSSSSDTALLSAARMTLSGICPAALSQTLPIPGIGTIGMLVNSFCQMLMIPHDISAVIGLALIAAFTRNHIMAMANILTNIQGKRSANTDDTETLSSFL